MSTPQPRPRRRFRTEQPELRWGGDPVGGLECERWDAEDRGVTPFLIRVIRRLGGASTQQVKALCELLWGERVLTNFVLEGLAAMALDLAGLPSWFPDARALAVALGYRICPVPDLAEIAVYRGGMIYWRASLHGTELQWVVMHELAHALLDDYCADDYTHADVHALTLALFFTRDHMVHFTLRGGVSAATRAGAHRCRAWIIRFRWALLKANPAIAA